MKRFSCSDSVSPHLLCSPQGEEVNMKEDCGGYSREFQAMLEGLDGEDSVEEIQMGGLGDKKRRLSNHQVTSLEKIFEVDNKLDPERKLKVAQDLGLQPRQVAIWFQNRRARWKTKQLERDYNHLKANYDALKLNYHNLQQERETILAQLVELKKLPEERGETNEYDTKEKPLFLGSHNNNNNSKQNYVEPEPEQAKSNHENDLYTTTLNLDKTRGLLDGLSDSDSSGVLNEDLNGQMVNVSPPPPRFDLSSLSTSNVLPPPLNYAQFLDSSRGVWTRGYQQQQFVKMEEQCFVTSSEESSCNIFSVDQPPNLYWYFPDHRTSDWCPN